jgi:hypothetical protein
MAGITATYENGCLRLYRTFLYRDSNNKPQRVRKSIGKVDSRIGKTIFNHFFKNILLKQNISLEKILNIPYHDIPNYVDFGNCCKEDIINRATISNLKDDYVNYNNKTIILNAENNENHETQAPPDPNDDLSTQENDLSNNNLRI